jgi:DNA-binding MurR/RpiR family transcriptional regulator
MEPLSYSGCHGPASDIQDTKTIWAKVQELLTAILTSLADLLRRKAVDQVRACVCAADRTAQVAVGGSAACLSAPQLILQVRRQRSCEGMDRRLS